jgi:chromate reductase
MDNKVIGIFIGSTRSGSFSRAIAKAAAELAPKDVTMRFIEIAHLPMYNQDLDNDENLPKSWAQFRKEAQEVDAVLFVTPEYNRSMPAVLKNALDVGSRPYGQSVWDGKPGAIISVSPGVLGAFGANHHLRQPMVFLNVLLLQQPEAYIGNVGNLLSDDGELINDGTRKYLTEYMAAFTKWVNTVLAAK